MDERRRAAGPLLILAILFTPIVAGGAYQECCRRRIASNEREASAALKQIASAEADFRSNDRDGNRVQDFWVGDVVGLYRYGRLIDLSLAEADARPLRPAVPTARAGYYFIAMQLYGDDSGTLLVYGQDTDGSGRKVHNPSSFAFCAYPAVYGVTGRQTFIISEGNTILTFDTGGTPLIQWPFDSSLKSHWEKID